MDPTVGIRIVSEYWARPFKDQTGFTWFILKETRCSLLLQWEEVSGLNYRLREAIQKPDKKSRFQMVDVMKGKSIR